MESTFHLCSKVIFDNVTSITNLPIVYDPVYDKLTGKSGYTEVYPKLAAGALRLWNRMTGNISECWL
ncbi:hypothetical protein [Paenibacillus segetis]|uniref:Uncharacterized protein n=1 Tax=Paenibacillus segetis TaxID=1325360 RepID=A0ABQ1YLX9_9BACL|nr:hypothetical protein [Paenibacillus segetis]GGH30207.1 hypothetical protein GCM10008013_33150 [Paenibacillus segetis]